MKRVKPPDAAKRLTVMTNIRTVVANAQFPGSIAPQVVEMLAELDRQVAEIEGAK